MTPQPIVYHLIGLEQPQADAILAHHGAPAQCDFPDCDGVPVVAVMWRNPLGGTSLSAACNEHGAALGAMIPEAAGWTKAPATQ